MESSTRTREQHPRQAERAELSRQRECCVPGGAWVCWLDITTALQGCCSSAIQKRCKPPKS